MKTTVTTRNVVSYGIMTSRQNMSGSALYDISRYVGCGTGHGVWIALKPIKQFASTSHIPHEFRLTAYCGLPLAV